MADRTPPVDVPVVPPEEFAERRRRVVERARERGLSGLLVWARGGTTVDYYGDVMYLTNHHSPFPPNTDTPIWSGRSYSAIVLPVDGEPVLVADLPDPPLDRIHIGDVRPTLQVPQTAARVLQETGLARGRLGLVGRDSFLVSHLRALEAELGEPLRFEPADAILEELRRIKSPTEIELMRHAARVGVDWMSTMLEAVEEGKTEAQFVGEGLRFVATQGGYPYDVAVASGPRSHEFERVGIPSWDYRRPLERGDLVHIDMWGPVECYYTDFVRSTVVGRQPTDAQRQVLEGSVTLIDHLIEAVRPGVKVADLYARGASWLVDNGFGAHRGEAANSGTVFGNLFPAFGHCIGLGLEPPWLIEGEPTVLEPGMVVAVECSVGLPDVGAAGFEQDVLVTADGSDVLTAACPARWWD